MNFNEDLKEMAMLFGNQPKWPVLLALAFLVWAIYKSSKRKGK
jgi:hypothetical protein